LKGGQTGGQIYVSISALDYGLAKNMNTSNTGFVAATIFLGFLAFV